MTRGRYGSWWEIYRHSKWESQIFRIQCSPLELKENMLYRVCFPLAFVPWALLRSPTFYICGHLTQRDVFIKKIITKYPRHAPRMLKSKKPWHRTETKLNETNNITCFTCVFQMQPAAHILLEYSRSISLPVPGCFFNPLSPMQVIFRKPSPRPQAYLPLILLVRLLFLTIFIIPKSPKQWYSKS